MIAIVRVAPVEHWCEFHKKRIVDPRRRKICDSLVGMEVEIFPSTMRMSISQGCLGRIWDISEKTHKRFLEKGALPQDLGICEHVLEMD